MAQNRQPLVIRGARQVGKTWLVRYFAKEQNRRLIELNFEKDPKLATFFNSNDPKQILLNLGSFFGETIHLKQCLLFLDVGLCSAALGLTLDQITNVNEIIFINSGGIAEQVVGQLLRILNFPYIEPALYYWLREGKNSAEIDYIIQQGSRLFPIEVKAGSTGSLKSLHLFMELKKLAIAFRINSDFPSQTHIQVKGQEGKDVKYVLLSIPFYLIGQIYRLTS